MKKILAGVLLFACVFTAKSQTLKYLTTIPCSHFVSGIDTGLSQAYSRTNNDSSYFQLVGTVGTLADSVGDSLFFLYNLAPYAGGVISMGVQPYTASDTLFDSVFVYENKAFISKYKIPNGPLNFGFTLTPSANAGVSRPEQFTIKAKLKKKAGKAKHTLRVRPNFITGQQ